MRTPPAALYGINIKEIARICGVSLKTAQRWKAGQSVPPKTALMMLERDLGCFHSEWAGWKISQRGELCSPENWIATPGHVRSLQMMQATLGTYRRENASLKAAVRHLEAQASGFVDQPLPQDWEIAVS
jgi:transcriptional regulator with XRE-family HTH domain